MENKYIKPIIEIMYTDFDKVFLVNHSEPEITSNIGSNENKTFDEEEQQSNINLWEE